MSIASLWFGSVAVKHRVRKTKKGTQRLFRTSAGARAKPPKSDLLKGMLFSPAGRPKSWTGLAEWNAKHAHVVREFADQLERNGDSVFFEKRLTDHRQGRHHRTGCQWKRHHL